MRKEHENLELYSVFDRDLISLLKKASPQKAKRVLRCFPEFRKFRPK